MDAEFETRPGNAVAAGGVSGLSVIHSGGWTWESHWLLLTEYYVRLEETYGGGAQIGSNVDLWAIVNSYLIDCYHFSEALQQDPALRVPDRDAIEYVRKTPALTLCQDYANTWKHSTRSSSSHRVCVIWKDGTRAGAHYVTIGYRLRDEPVENQKLIDALELARDSYGAWQSFMQSHQIQEPVAIIEPVMSRLRSSPAGPQQPET